MRPAAWPDWIEETVWAKSADKGAQGKPESLAQHTYSVLLRLRDFMRLRPSLPAQSGQPELWNILFWAAFFHDFGKVMPGFQSMLRGGDRWGHRHEVFSLAFLSWIDFSFSSENQARLAAAVVSHHRDAEKIFELYPSIHPGEKEWLDEEFAGLSADVISGLWRWLVDCSAAWIRDMGLSDLGVKTLQSCDQEHAVQEILNHGAQNIRKRLKLFRRLVRQQEEEINSNLIRDLLLRGHIINADHSASAHIGEYPKVQVRREQIISRRNLDPGSLYHHQELAGRTTGNALLIAPTGSGKTEAALFWAAAQNEPEGSSSPRLFYTLPYQASMNAMSLRLKKIFGERLVGLQHGRSRLAIYRQLMERSYSPRDAASAAKLARNLADLNYPPLRVFSPFQMLKAMYRLKGYEAQLSDYHQALFIFDEIHAYEVRRLAMILKTMAYLRQHFAARFFVMSATFPALIKNWLREALPDVVEIRAEQQLYRMFQRHRLKLVEGDLLEPRYLDLIASEARSGKSVLVVCNVVSRAQQAYDYLFNRLKRSGIPVELIHGRFNLRDRLHKEKLVQEYAGSESHKRPVLLIATQVVEVSLDIDLNTIYTDPAPLEALVQRFGRINRARKMLDLATVHVFTQPDDGQKIYDPALVNAAMDILTRENGKPVDESAIDGWLDEIYSGEIRKYWEQSYSRAAADFEAACIQTLRPFQSDHSLEDAFYRAFDGIEVLPEPLLDEYERIRKETPIAAGELLVPISWGRYHALANTGRVLPRDQNMPPVVKVGYNAQTGLTFEESIEAEDDL